LQLWIKIFIEIISIGFIGAERMIIWWHAYKINSEVNAYYKNEENI